MAGLFRRLVAGTVAYQAPSIVASLLALITIRLYTSELTEAEFGYAETLLTFIILGSILLRLGVGEALVRFWFDDEDPGRRQDLARTVTAWTLWTTTPLALLGVAFASPISRLLLDNHDDATLMSFGFLGLWAFSNLEIAYALLRVEERRRAFVTASLANVLLTVALTVGLVVFAHTGARGYVAGNYGASAIVLLALWWTGRHRFSAAPPRGVRALLAFGGPTVPADATVFALNVIDRAYLLRADSPDAAGRYAFAAKLSTVVIVAVRGFQAAWPPLAYSVTDEEQARRLYARVTTAYVMVTGLVVCAIALLGRWAVRALAGDPGFEEASTALPWVALGWALYGLVQVQVTIAGRAKVTTRNFPATAAGLVANVVLLVLLVGPLGIAGAGIALCGAYVVIVFVLHHLTRGLFHVPFEWGRLARTVAVLALCGAGGELLLPTSGWDGLLTRALVAAAAAPLLVAAGAVRASELRALMARRRGAAAQ